MELSEVLEREEYLNRLVVSIDKNTDLFSALPKKGIPLFVIVGSLAVVAAVSIFFDLYLLAVIIALCAGFFYKVKYEKLRTDWNALSTIVQYEANPIYLLPLDGKIKPLEGIYFEIVEPRKKTNEELEAEIEAELLREGEDGYQGERIFDDEEDSPLMDDAFNAKKLVNEVAEVPVTRRYDMLIHRCEFLWRLAVKRDVIPKLNKSAQVEGTQNEVVSEEPLPEEALPEETPVSETVAAESDSNPNAVDSTENKTPN